MSTLIAQRWVVYDSRHAARSWSERRMAVGRLHYDGHAIEIDDRTLAHLHIVIVNRLRKGDTFAVSWLNALSKGGGRGSIWVHPSIPIRFSFAGSRPASINPSWIEALDRSASSSTGLIVLDEQGHPARCG